MVDTERTQRRPAVIVTEHGDGMDGTDPRAGALRRVRLAAALGVVVLAILGYASFEFVGHATDSDSGRAAAAGSARAPSASTTPAGVRGPAGVSATPHATVTSPPPATRGTQHAATAPRLLVLAGVAAFGPLGMADGDNPQDAANVISHPATGWRSQWYATASFGDLKDGTGLLLDMGRTVTITSVRLRLGALPGARLELRLGSVPSLADLRVARTATATGDLLTITLATPASARYILLWFTRLPRDAAGSYQLSVHQVTVDGWR
jgi:hypothetical protein